MIYECQQLITLHNLGRVAAMRPSVNNNCPLPTRLECAKISLVII